MPLGSWHHQAGPGLIVVHALGASKPGGHHPPPMHVHPGPGIMLVQLLLSGGGAGAGGGAVGSGAIVPGGHQLPLPSQTQSGPG